MRRPEVIMAVTAVAVLALSFTLQLVEGTEVKERYHQHREWPSEEDLGICPVCGSDQDRTSFKEGHLCTHLPILCIETDGQKIPGTPIEASDDTAPGYETAEDGSTEIVVHYSTRAEKGVWHHPEDPATETGDAKLRIRGNSSRWFSKHSYLLRMVDGQNPEMDCLAPLLGMDPGSEWALHGPFLDKTMLRNYMCMNLAGQIMSWTPEVRFCELVLDGEYQGLYVAMEMIRVEPGRLELTKYRQGDLMCSWLVRVERRPQPYKTLDNFTAYTLRLERNSNLELLYPGTQNQTEAVKEYVTEDFNSVEQMLYGQKMGDESDAWKNVINMDSMVDYYILEEFLAVNDTFSASTYFYRDRRGKVCIGPVWDFNNALDNFFTPMPKEELILSQRGWFAQLMKDEEFVRAVIRRYHALRRGILSDEALKQYVAEVDAWLGTSLQRDDRVWGYAYDPKQLSSHECRRPEQGSGLTLEDVNWSSHEEAVEWMTGFMEGRGQFMDAYIESLLQYCHPSKR